MLRWRRGIFVVSETQPQVSLLTGFFFGGRASSIGLQAEYDIEEARRSLGKAVDRNARIAAA